MSQVLVQQYLSELAKLGRVSGSTRESVVGEAFKNLLEGGARSHDLAFVPVCGIETPRKERRHVDGAPLHLLRVRSGCREARDEKDDLDAEIGFRKRRGDPQDNFVSEDSREAALIRNLDEVFRGPVDGTAGPDRLLKRFFSCRRPESADLRNRCAPERILDRHEENTPKHSTTRGKFDTFRFADGKEKVVDLLTRVTTASVETMRAARTMRCRVRIGRGGACARVGGSTRDALAEHEVSVAT